jgi:hypothetical protein
MHKIIHYRKHSLVFLLLSSQPLPSNEQVQEEEEEQELDIFDQAKRDLKKGVIRPASQNEYEDYISGDLYEYVGLKGQADALSWWCQL